jgi:hypothetical protein
MKTILVLAFMASVWFAGCASSPKPNLSKEEAARINWGERIGILTYEQAVADLGPPAVLGESSAGKTAEWVLHRSPNVSFGLGVGAGSFGHSSAVGVGAGSSVSPPPHGENLRLIFNEQGRLTEWTKVRY